MPTGPDDGARLAFEAVELVTAAELAVLRAVAERLRAGMDAPGWAASKLAELQLLRAGLARDLAAMDVALAAQVTSTLQNAYRNGQALAVADLDDVSVRPVLPPARWAAVETLAADVGSRVTGHAPRVLRAVTDAYQQAVGAGAGSVVLGGQTRRQAAQTVLDRLLGEGITGFTDRAGRNWHLESYVEMAVRTGAGQAAIQGHVDTLAASGQDLFQVIPGPRACPVCDGWAGKVLSATGGTTSIVAAGTSSVVDGTLEDARGAGWGHPNCRCVLGIYLPGVTSPVVQRPDPGGHVAGQRQRELERRIRSAKRREAVALDDAAGKAARGRVRDAQAQLRAHLVAHPELKRLRYRAQIGGAI